MAASFIDLIVVILVLILIVNGTKMARLFLGCYLPLLIFIPSEFISPFQGIPHTNPAQTAIFVMGGIFLLSHFSRWKVSSMDWLVLIYLALYNYSEWTADMSETGEKTIAVELTASLTEVLFPYMFAKTFIGWQGLHVAFSQRLIFLVFLVTLLMPFEVRLTKDPFYYYLNWIYDVSESGPPLLRYGHVRYMGPFTHPILAGSILATCLLLDVWLIKNNLWEKMNQVLKWFIAAMLGLSLLATSSRAPMIGFGMGYILSRIGYNIRRLWRNIAVATILLVSFSSIIYYLIASYVDINTEVATSEAQGTLEYRMDLIPSFTPIVEERFWLGWGNLGWPKPNGEKMVSIDNHYLWLALRHGMLTLGVFLAMPLIMIIKLFWRGIQLRPEQKLASTLVFTLFSIFCTQLIIYYTVFMGGQTTALFFILLGWAEGLLLYLQRTKEDIPNIQIKNYKTFLKKLRKA